MRTIVGIIYCLVFSAVACRAQGTPLGPTFELNQSVPRCLAAGEEVDSLNLETPPCTAERESSTAVASDYAPAEALPDAPLPKPVSNNYNNLPTPFHLDEHDRSWGQAMRNPLVLSGSLALAGLTSLQLIKTDHCIDANKPACNLLTGKNRGAAYAVNVPLTAGIIWAAGKLKQEGKSTGLLFLLTAGLASEGTLAYTANPRVLVCEAGRTPQCQ
jgi:hypothetical protein